MQTLLMFWMGTHNATLDFKGFGVVDHPEVFLDIEWIRCYTVAF